MEFIETLKDKEEITEEDTNKVIELLQSNASILEKIGDLCREEKHRNALAKDERICSELVKYLDAPMLIEQFAIRAIGNLAYQNETIRNVFVSLGVPRILLGKLRKYENSFSNHTFFFLLRNIAGTLANLTFICDDEVDSLREESIVTYLYKLIEECPSAEVVIMSLRALSNLTENRILKEEIGRIEGTQCNFFQLILSRFDAFDESRKEVIALFNSLVEENPGNALNFAEAGGIEVIVRFVFDDVDDDYWEEERAESWKLLNHIASNEGTLEKFFKKGIAGIMIEESRKYKSNDKVLAAILSFSALLVVHEEMMMEYLDLLSELCDNLLNREKPVRIASTLLLANIARSDKVCETLGKREEVVKSVLTFRRRTSTKPRSWLYPQHLHSPS